MSSPKLAVPPPDFSSLISKPEPLDLSSFISKPAPALLDLSDLVSQPPTLDWKARAEAAEKRVAELEAQKDAAYEERDRCVSLIAAMAHRLGFRVGLAEHPPSPGWDPEWRTIVFVDLGSRAGQVSWHIHESERPWFPFGDYPDTWDGHSTPEKYARIENVARDLSALPPLPSAAAVRDAVFDACIAEVRKLHDQISAALAISGCIQRLEALRRQETLR